MSRIVQPQGYSKVDEMPFDFVRRRLSIVVKDSQSNHLLVCKGAVEEMLSIATHMEENGKVIPSISAVTPCWRWRTTTTKTASAFWWSLRATFRKPKQKDCTAPLMSTI
jgi:magnesium-transporting ATPase (P-type)